jgi:hypothetical protein
MAGDVSLLHSTVCDLPCTGNDSMFSLGVKQPEREVDQKSSSDAKVKYAWSYSSALPYIFVA